MRFHIIALPHTQVSREFAVDPFTEKVRRFTTMLTEAGHTTYLYAGEVNEATASEHIVCFNEQERLEAVGSGHYTEASYDPRAPHWLRFNARVISAMKQRIEPHDFICLTGGIGHRPVAEAFPNHLSVEYAVGYGASFAKHRVFESYAWMHSTYAADRNPAEANGEFFDDVIPGFLEPEMFPFVEQPDDYYLFIGRVIPRKGVQIAAEVCEAIGKRLLIAGPGEPPAYGEYLGPVDAETRAKLMGSAIATFVPTLYIEPFGYVVIESQMCGTPTITTDWGAFPEINPQGVTGYRCRSFQEFIDAAENARTLDRRAIRGHAMARYTTDVILPRYEAYFERLSSLWQDGWYQRRPTGKVG